MAAARKLQAHYLTVPLPFPTLLQVIGEGGGRVGSSTGRPPFKWSRMQMPKFLSQ
jgi:hypothetical protein